MPVNERLRTVMLRTGTTEDDLALCCGVDVKTVGRWISLGRVPHRQHRWSAAARLGADEAYLWPEAAPARQQASNDELVRLYADRASVPRETWIRLMAEARDEIAVLVMSGTFYAQTQPRVGRLLAEAASRGVRVRLCFGDPSSQAVAIRDAEEGIAGTLAAKIRSNLTYYRDIARSCDAAVRLHGCTLYASIFRYDDDVLANPHTWGAAGSANPVMHLRRLDGGQVATHYTDSFERVWDTAKPWHGEDL